MSLLLDVIVFYCFLNRNCESFFMIEKKFLLINTSLLFMWPFWKSNTISARWSSPTSTLISHVGSMYLWHSVMWMVLYLYSLLPQNPQPQCNHKISVRYILVEWILQKIWQALLKNIMIINNSENLKCESPEVLQEIWWLHGKWKLEEMLEQKKDAKQVKTETT